MRTPEQLEAWLAACIARETTLGFDAWVEQQNPNVIDPDRAWNLDEDVRLASTAFRNYMRPLAVKVLGDWALDDTAANRNARSWSAKVSRSGETVTFLDTLFATGHNETTTRKEYKVDFTGRIVKHKATPTERIAS